MSALSQPQDAPARSSLMDCSCLCRFAFLLVPLVAVTSAACGPSENVVSMFSVVLAAPLSCRGQEETKRKGGLHL